MPKSVAFRLGVGGGAITGHGHAFTSTDAVVQPGVPRFQYIFQRLLGGVALTGAMFQVRDIADKAIVFLAPIKVDVIVRDVHFTMPAN